MKRMPANEQSSVLIMHYNIDLGRLIKFEDYFLLMNRVVMMYPLLASFRIQMSNVALCHNACPSNTLSVS